MSADDRSGLQVGGDSRMAHPVVPILIGVVVLLGGGYLYYSGMQASANAESVDATVVSSSVVESDDVGSNSQDRDEYTVSVEYRYTYDGTDYTSESLCPGTGSACKPSSDFRTNMEGFLADYPEGETVTAYVQPDSPDDAHLIQSGPSLVYLGVAGFGLLLVGLGVKRFSGG